MTLREKLAAALVRHVASAIDESYAAQQKIDAAANEDEEQYWIRIQDEWRQAYRWRQPLLHLAQAIHQEATVDTMVEEGWWG